MKKQIPGKPSSVPNPGQFYASSEELELASLMRKSQSGDELSYRTLLRKLSGLIQKYLRPRLHRFRSRACQSTLEDLRQEILLVIHAKKGTFDPSRPFLPWFYAIVRYKTIDLLRQLMREKSNVTLTEEELDAEIGGYKGEYQGVAIDLQESFKSLNPRQRTCLELVKLKGYTHQEAAEIVGLSDSNVKVIVHRAIKALQFTLRLDIGLSF